jgi:hypothetical protein
LFAVFFQHGGVVLPDLLKYLAFEASEELPSEMFAQFAKFSGQTMKV